MSYTVKELLLKTDMSAVGWTLVPVTVSFS